jgi:hypothetical protein
MDFKQIKNKLGNLNSKSNKEKKYEKVDYSKVYWRPAIGTHQIRIVPSVLNKNFPFQEVFFHYGFSNFPILALSNWGEQDPIVDFAKGLKETGDREDWKLGIKLEPKMRTFVPVIVRGEEEKGVRLWEFGKEIYKQLLSLAADEDYGDFTDVQNGFDFTVEVVEGDLAGKKVKKVDSVRIKRKESVLTENPEQLNKWLTEQPKILEVGFKNSFESLKNILNKWLNPESEVSSATNSDNDQNNDEDEEDNVPDDLPFTVEETPNNKKKKKDFNSLFESK